MARVLMMSTISPTIEQFNVNNINILQSLGYEVHIATDFTDESIWPIEKTERFRAKMEEQGVKCFQIDFSRSMFKIGKHVKAYRQLKKLMKENEYAFIHTHTPIASVVGRLVAHGLGIKVIYTAHGFHFYTGAPLKNWLIFYPIEWLCSWWTDVLITINKEDYKRASEHFHAKKTVYIPGVGVDTAKFAVCKVDKKAKRQELGLKDTDFVLLSVGELSERKNQKVIIDALGKMKPEGNLENIVYLAVGEGYMREEFEKLIRQYGLEAHVKLLGYRTDIDELCEIADCFVHPSIREGLGIAPLEAMASGLPLISADINGIKDYTEDNVSGCCIEPMDVDAMIKAIRRMYIDESFRQQCGANNLKTVKTFDINNSLEVMNTVYNAAPPQMMGYRHLKAIMIRQKMRKELNIGLNTFVVISVGELNDNKNHQVVIRAIADLSNAKFSSTEISNTELSNIAYIIVGKGILENNLRRLAEQLGVSDRVIFAGYKTSSDIRDLLWTSDCFAFPSKREGLGLAAIEAMAAGLPVIGNNVGGIKDYLINGVTGLFANDVCEYVKKINFLETQNETYHKLSLRVQERSKFFDHNIIQSIIGKVYANLKLQKIGGFFE